MNVLVFGTYNVPPEDWAAFRAAVREEAEASRIPHIDYHVLVYSRTHSEEYLQTPTKDLQDTVQTEFKSMEKSWTDIKNLFQAWTADLKEMNLSHLHFFILEANSIKDRKIRVVEKWKEFFAEDGKLLEDYADGPHSLRSWKIYRVPFREVGPATTALDRFCDGYFLSSYLERFIRENLDGSWPVTIAHEVPLQQTECWDG